MVLLKDTSFLGCQALSPGEVTSVSNDPSASIFMVLSVPCLRVPNGRWMLFRPLTEASSPKLIPTVKVYMKQKENAIVWTDISWPRVVYFG